MRRVLLAAAVSVAVHAAVALAFASGAPAPRPVAVEGPTPVEVEVMRVAAVVPRVETPAPAAVVKPTRAAGVKPVATAKPSTEGALPEEPRGPARAEAAATAEAPAAEVVPSDPPAVDSVRGPPALDTTELSRRLQAVAARCYPAAARRFRQTGEAEVRFCLDAAGALAESTVSRSSGSDLLDRAASGCVVPGAAPFGAEAHGHCFTVPVRFRQ